MRPVPCLLLPLLSLLSLALAAAAETPPSPAAAVAAALARFEQARHQDPAAAGRALDEALAAERTPPLLQTKALWLAARGDESGALKLLDEALAAAPALPGAQRQRGLLLARQGQWRQAAADLRPAPGNPHLDAEQAQALAICYLHLELPAAAETACRQALLLAPESPALHLLLAQTLLPQQRWEEAAALARQAQQRGSPDPAAWQVLIAARLGARQDAAALDALEAAARLCPPPEREDWRRLRAELYLRLRMPEEAAGALLAGSDAPGPERLEEAAEALLEAGQTEAAGQVLARLPAAAAQSARGQYLAARQAAAAGDAARALSLAEAAVAKDGGKGPALLLLGRLQARAGQRQAALDSLRAAQAFAATRAQGLRQELELWLGQRQWEEARQTLRRLQQAEPQTDFRGLVQSLERLEAGGPGKP